jgi:hypothetical protein
MKALNISELLVTLSSRLNLAKELRYSLDSKSDAPQKLDVEKRKILPLPKLESRCQDKTNHCNA